MKHNVTNSGELKKAMEDLQQKINMQEVKMKDHYELIKVDLQPKNIIKNTYSHIGESPEIQRTLLNTIIGFVIGYGFKKAKELMNEETMDRLGKNLVHSVLDKVEAHNPQGILSKGVKMLRKTTPEDSRLHPFIGYNQQT